MHNKILNKVWRATATPITALITDISKPVKDWRAATTAVTTHTVVLFTLGNGIYAAATHNYVGAAIQLAVCTKVALSVAKSAGTVSAGDPPFGDLGRVDILCGAALFSELAYFGAHDYGWSLFSQQFAQSHLSSAVAYAVSGFGHMAKSRGRDAASTFLYGFSSIATTLGTVLANPTTSFDPASFALITAGTAKALSDLPQSQSKFHEKWQLAQNMLLRHVTPARIFAGAYGVTAYSACAAFIAKPEPAGLGSAVVPCSLWVAGFLCFDREQNRAVLNFARRQVAKLTA